MAASRSRKRPGRLLETLDQLIQNMPTEDEKRQVLNALDDLSTFVDAVRSAIDRLPSIGDIEGAREALEKLNSLQADSGSSSVLASSLNPGKSKTSSRDKPLTDEEKLAGAKNLDALKSMSTESIAGILEDSDRYSWRDLRSIAYALGVRSAKGYRRDSLVHLIVTKVSNSRGYAILRGNAPI